MSFDMPEYRSDSDLDPGMVRRIPVHGGYGGLTIGERVAVFCAITLGLCFSAVVVFFTATAIRWGYIAFWAAP